MKYNFPLYVVRSYREISVEGEYKVITTARNRYVLDIVNYSEPLYAVRRLQLLAENLPYTLYPINKIVTSIKELLAVSNASAFLDKEGRLVKWVKKKNFKILARKIVKYWEVPGGYMVVAEVTGLTYFIPASEYDLETHIEVLVSNNTETFVRVLPDPALAKTRKKL